jgi:hypothetical protein
VKNVNKVSKSAKIVSQIFTAYLHRLYETYPKNVVYFFHGKKQYVLIFVKKGFWLHFWAIFSQTHLVTLNIDSCRMSAAVDFFTVFTFNMHGHGESVADHHAPLRIRDFEQTSANPVSMVGPGKRFLPEISLLRKTVCTGEIYFLHFFPEIYIVYKYFKKAIYCRKFCGKLHFL